MSGQYERIAARFAPVQDELVERLRVQPGDRVLDLATGTGEVAIRAARAGGDVTAIDIAEPMIEKARRRARRGRRRRQVRPRRRRVPALRGRVLRRPALELRPRLRARPRQRRRGARARHVQRRPGRLHRVEAELEARRALPPVHRRADRGPRSLRVGPRGSRRGDARRGLRARVRGRHALDRGRLGRGDLAALLRIRAARRDAARPARRRAEGGVPQGVRRPAGDATGRTRSCACRAATCSSSGGGSDGLRGVEGAAERDVG